MIDKLFSFLCAIGLHRLEEVRHPLLVEIRARFQCVRCGAKYVHSSEAGLARMR